MSEDMVSVVCNVRDAKAGDRIDIFGNGAWVGTVTNRIYQVPNDPLGPFFRDVIWITPPFGGMKKSGFRVYRNREDYKAHKGGLVHGA